LVRIHAGANRLPIHVSPLFLPWHRAFVLDLERRLQAINPAVTIPYWRYDQKTTRIFAADFMGVTSPGVPTPEFAPNNRLALWSVRDVGGLIRDPQQSAPADGLADPARGEALVEATFPPVKAYIHFRDRFETGFHNGVHRGLHGVNGVMGGASSPADPLFFLLHANVDRVWAHWQAKHDRFDSSQEEAYSHPGKFPGTAATSQESVGVYTDDPMWPWSDPGAVLSGSDVSPWPPIVHPMPPSIHVPNPVTITPGGQIDYLDVAGKGLALGYCYDDIEFRGRVLTLPP
jgi:tyrosinase